MKLGVILLMQALLVGAGIFAYDSLRGSEHHAGSATSEPQREMAHDAPVVAKQPVLEGSGWDAMKRRLDALEKRLGVAPPAEKTAGIAPAQDGTTGDSGPSSPAATGTQSPDEVGGVPIDVGDPQNPKFDPHQVAQFRAMLDEVERQRTEERRTEGIKAQLKRLDLRLTDDQEKAVVAARLTYDEKRGEMFRNMAQDGNADREQRQAAMETLKTDYQHSLESIVGAADAQKIVDSTTRVPGMGGGRIFGGRTGTGSAPTR